MGRFFTMTQRGSQRSHSIKCDSKSSREPRLRYWLCCGITLLYVCYLVRKGNDSTIRLLPVFEACQEPQAYGKMSQKALDAMIPCKIQQASTHFKTKRARQSTSVQAAKDAYERRYKRKPPRLFDIWADFALQHRSPVIDDFDQIERDLRPFRDANFDKGSWQRLISAAKEGEPGEMLGTLSIVDGNVVAFGPLRGTMSVTTLEALVQPIAPFLPDLGILFNWYAEPRVLAERQDEGQFTSFNDDGIVFANFSGQSTMNLLSNSCPYDGLSDEALLVPTKNFCKQAKKSPQSVHQHGFYSSPDHFHPTWTQIPLLSRAKLSVFKDILAPNVCYGHTDYRIWGENDTLPFTSKRKDLYWRGSMTGMSMTSSNWYQGQRHRVVRYTQSMREFITGSTEGKPSLLWNSSSLPPSFNGEIRQVISSLPASAFDVGFSGTGRGCDPSICDKIKDELPLKSRDPPQESFKHQFVLDVDGQSMSCRFYSLLESNSVVFKQTIWGEWHDDRLVPWLHYIPIDIDLLQHEIPRFLSWFTNSARGQQYAAFIGEQSRAWAEMSLRSIDLTIYLFRIFIEIDGIIG